MSESVSGVANVEGESQTWTVTFSGNLSKDKREELANGIKSLAESCGCQAAINVQNK